MTWPPATLARARDILSRYPEPRSAVMPLLYVAMHEEGGLTDAGMRQVAELTGTTPVQVESVASFYNMYLRHPGRHVVTVCRSISCHLLGAGAVRDAVTAAAGVPEGETAPDGSVTIMATECIGACGGAPAIQVDYETVEGMTPEAAQRLIAWLRDEHPAAVRSDELQERFGGRRSFDWGPEDATAAAGPVPAFGMYGTAGGAGS